MEIGIAVFLMAQAIFRATSVPVRVAGRAAAGFAADWAWLGAVSFTAFGGALLGERMLILVFG